MQIMCMLYTRDCMINTVITIHRRLTQLTWDHDDSALRLIIFKPT